MHHLFLVKCFDFYEWPCWVWTKFTLIISYSSSEGTVLAAYFNLARNCNYGFSDGITLRCYYMKSTDILMVICEHIITSKSALGSVCSFHRGSTLTPVKLVPNHSASRFMTFPPLAKVFCPLSPGSFSFHLHFQDFVLIPFLI